MGACTWETESLDVEKDKRVVRGTLTFSSDYATSGDTLSAALLGLRSVDDLVADSGSDIGTPAGYALKLGGTAAAPKVLVYTSAGQVANATDLSAVEVAVRVYGTD